MNCQRNSGGRTTITLSVTKTESGIAPVTFSLAGGNAVGAWWAAKLSIKKGEKIIRLVLFAVVLAMAIKLLDLI